MTVSNRDLAVTLAIKIYGEIGRGRRKTLTAAECDELLSDCQALNSLIGDASDHVINDLMESVRRLKVGATNSDLLTHALDLADHAKTLAYDMQA